MIRRLYANHTKGTSATKYANKTNAGKARISSEGVATALTNIGTDWLPYDTDSAGNMTTSGQEGMDLEVPDEAGLFVALTYIDPDGFTGTYPVEGGTTAPITLEALKTASGYNGESGSSLHTAIEAYLAPELNFLRALAGKGNLDLDVANLDLDRMLIKLNLDDADEPTQQVERLLYAAWVTYDQAVPANNNMQTLVNNTGYPDFTFLGNTSSTLLEINTGQFLPEVYHNVGFTTSSTSATTIDAADMTATAINFRMLINASCFFEWRLYAYDTHLSIADLL